MDKLVYALCALTCAACALLLLRGYRRSKMRLLLWSTICFTCLTLANIGTYIDLVVFQDVDLQLARGCVTILGLGALIFGMIKETV
jgi:hypothetical protein